MSLRRDARTRDGVIMRKRIEDALRTLPRMADGEILVVTLRAPVRPTAAIFHAGIVGERVYWDGRAEGGWALAGIGTTARVEGDGNDALAEVRRASEQVFASVERSGEWNEGPRHALFGGAAFDPSVGADEAWEGFASASFALPRWVYGTRGDRGFVRLALKKSPDVDIDGLLAEADAVVRTLEGPFTSPVCVLSPARLEELPRAVWDELIAQALSSIEGGAVDKLVAARRTRAVGERPYDPIATVLLATAADPDVAGFVVERGGRSFVGATPERLVVLQDRGASADALAGSAQRDGGSADALLASEKDVREHAVVVEAIRAVLGGFATTVESPPMPVVRTLRHLHHLWTPIRAAVHPGTHVLDLVSALHPTPAVAGHPMAASRAWIAAHEPASRGWYAGPVGWFNEAGEGAFVVALRSAVLSGRSAWMYAGAGIVRGSTAAGEWAETAAKFRPMRSALGIDA